MSICAKSSAVIYYAVQIAPQQQQPARLVPRGGGGGACHVAGYMVHLRLRRVDLHSAHRTLHLRPRGRHGLRAPHTSTWPAHLPLRIGARSRAISRDLARSRAILHDGDDGDHRQFHLLAKEPGDFLVVRYVIGDFLVFRRGGR